MALRIIHQVSVSALTRVRSLGIGGEGEALLVRTPTGKLVVRKIYLHLGGPNPRIPFELHIYFAILDADSWFTTMPIGLNLQGRPSVLLEYSDGGSLADVIDRMRRQGGRFPESFLWHVLLHLSIGTIFLHTSQKYNTQTRTVSRPTRRAGVIHRDLHQDNILIRHSPLSDGTSQYPDIVITDFGHASITGGGPSASRSALAWGRNVEREVSIDGAGRFDVWPPERGETGSGRPPQDTRYDFFQIVVTIRLMASVGENDAFGRRSTYSSQLRGVVMALGALDPEDRLTDASLIRILPTIQESRDYHLSRETRSTRLSATAFGPRASAYAGRRSLFDALTRVPTPVAVQGIRGAPPQLRSRADTAGLFARAGPMGFIPANLPAPRRNVGQTRDRAASLLPNNVLGIRSITARRLTLEDLFRRR